MRKIIRNLKRVLSSCMGKLIDIFYRIVTKETIVPLHEIEIYVNSDLELSIGTDSPYRGYIHQPIMLRCFSKKRRSFYKSFLFLRNLFTINKKENRFCNRTVSMSVKKLLLFLKKGKKEKNGVIFTSTKNSKILWKVYVINKSAEPENLKKLGAIGLDVLNVL